MSIVSVFVSLDSENAWLSHRLLKCQLPTSGLPRTPITQMIYILNQGKLLLGLNHFLTYNIVVAF